MTEPAMESPSPRPRSALAKAGWFAFSGSVIGLAALGFVAAKSARRASGLEHAVAACHAQHTLLVRARDEAQQRVTELEQEKQRLSGDLQETAAQKQAAQVELERTRAELASKLESEIKQGEVVVRMRGGDLVVDVSDKVLFDTGKADINDRGKEVLKQVAASIVRMPNRVFQVSGHTDAARVKSSDVREHFPTNWELSTARATNVVRFLQEKCGIPGRRLVAAGYGEHQPVASNATENGRRRNRRIEMALLKEKPAE